MSPQPDPAQSEWLKVMLGEVERKQQEAALARAEEELRRAAAATPADVRERNGGRGRKRS